MSNDEFVAFIINEIITKRASVKDLAKIIESKIIRNSR